MNLATLEQYVADMNSIRAMFDEPALSILNPQDRHRIASKIDSDLSPEALTCDGELPAKVVRQRYKRLVKCAEQLYSIDPTVKIHELVL